MSCHVVILGAGIAGLAAAWFLKQSFGSHIRITLLEKSARAGGWIETIQTEGFLFEQGPRSYRSGVNGWQTLALIEALDLQDQVLVPSDHARHRYLYEGNRLKKMPSRLWKIPFHSLTRGWAQALWRDCSMPKCQLEDESIQAFFSRRMGISWAERLIDPFVLGIYAGNFQSLSLKSCFPLFSQWEQQYGSLLKGAWNYRPSFPVESSFIQSMSRCSLFSFKEGMETLPRALAQQLKESLYLGQGAKSIRCASKGMEVQLERGELVKADYVISTLPAFALSSLIVDDPLLAVQLKELSYATVVVVNLGFHASILPLQGFGYLVPSKENSLILGCIWDSSIFPQHQQRKDQTRLTVMMGGYRYREMEQMSEQEIIEYVLKNLHQHLKIRMQPHQVQIKKAQQAIPQYEVGYSIWKQALQKKLLQFSPRLIVSGSAWNGVSINDSIAHAHSLASQFSPDTLP